MSTQVREGDILAGKYRIDKVLGVGGMGVVVAAHHVALDEKVAIKFLLSETLANGEAVARFAREARAAVKIKSEHVARISDVGKLENGAPYMVMEYLEGRDLAHWLAERGALPIEQAVEFVLQGCEAIAEAHALGIVHRDLKPANLFVVRRADGVLSIKVLDFGISKMTSLTGSGSDASMTKTSALMGSPLYMSPEQMRSSKDVDARGDIWALGVVLYELVTAVTPFNGETMPELILQVMSQEPPPLRDKRPDAPNGLESVILKCLSKGREARFQTVGQLAVALLPFAPRRSKSSVERISGVLGAAGLSTSALELPPSSDSTRTHLSAAGAGTAASWGRTTAGTQRRPWLLVAIVALSVIAAAALLARRHISPVGPAGAASPTAAAEPSASIAVAPLPLSVPLPPAVPAASEEPPAAPRAGFAPSATGPLPASPAAPTKEKPRAPSIPAARPPAVQAAKPAKPTEQWGDGRL